MASAAESAGTQPATSRRNPAKFVSPRTVAIYGILTALTTAVTMAIAVPFPPTRGFFNLGDSMVFFSAFTFGWRAGAICGGIGSAAADVLLGFGYFAPITLVAKGSEGLFSGLISDVGKRKPTAKVLGVAIGGASMISTYFLAELILYGFGPALAEIPVNVTQVVFGGSIGLLLSVPVSSLLQTTGRAIAKN